MSLEANQNAWWLWLPVSRRLRTVIRQMQSPDELDGLLRAIYQGLLDLQLCVASCAIHVVQRHGADVEVVSHVLKDGTLTRTSGGGSATFLAAIHAGGDISYRPDLRIEDPLDEHQQHKGTFCSVDVPFEYGILGVASTCPEAFGDEELEILNEMASLLEDGFRRTHELTGLRARHRVEEEVWRMRTKEDISQVMAALRASLGEMGLGAAGCGINLLVGHDNVRSHDMRVTKPWMESPSTKPVALLQRFWKEGKTVYRPDLLREDRFGECEWVHGLFKTNIRCILDVPFSHGTVAINSPQPDAFSPQDIRFLEEMAAVLSEGFRRTDDLEALEERNSALEREVEEHRVTAGKLNASVHEKVILLKEIHHRVKNNLQIVSSLLNLQSNNMEDAAAIAGFTECSARIQSMALLHEQLYESHDLARVDLANYLGQLASNLVVASTASTAPIELKRDLETLHVHVDTAMPCGLIVNELLSNSLKHGFTQARGGTLQLHLARCGEHVVLRVADDGVGLAEGFDPATSTGLGVQLVKALSQQMRGEIAWHNESGVTVELRFPLESTAH